MDRSMKEAKKYSAARAIGIIVRNMYALGNLTYFLSQEGYGNVRNDSPFQPLFFSRNVLFPQEGLEENHLSGSNCHTLEENLFPFLQGLDEAYATC